MSDSPSTPPVDHVWNDPDGDGHNCVDCASDSIWKCDKAAHWPPLKSPRDLLTDEENRQLTDDLAEMARLRRRAADEAGGMHLG